MQNTTQLRDARLYKISFVNYEKIYEIFAKQVYESDLYGFITVEEIQFGTRSQVVIDPSEEKLKTEFEHVKRTFIPLHAIIRIDEVKKNGISKIRNTEKGTKETNISHFPSKIGIKKRK